MDARRRSLMKNTQTGGGPIVGDGYVIDLNGAWRLSTTKINPNPSLLAGVYESFGIENSTSSYPSATMYITIKGLTSFKFYIAATGSSFSYVYVSRLDESIPYNPSSSDVYAQSSTNSTVPTSLVNYKEVEFTNIDGGEHVITIAYKTNNLSSSNEKCGYLLIDHPGYEDVPEFSVDNEIVNNYLTIESLEYNTYAKVSKDCEYCVDGNGTWNSLTANTNTVSVGIGHTLSFRSNWTTGYSQSTREVFTVNGVFNLKGNAMSMLYGDDAASKTSTEYSSALANLFYNNTGLKSVSDSFLPATTLSANAYSHMFRQCTRLSNAPKLPATTLANACYSYMFSGCKSLTDSPILPATTLTQGCYSYMFSGCTSIKNRPDLPATTLARGCYSHMHANTKILPDCTNIDFTQDSGVCLGLFAYTDVTDDYLTQVLPVNNLGKYYINATNASEMFTGCKLLVTAPDINPTSTSWSYYRNMFDGCISLENPPTSIPETVKGEDACGAMFSGCSSLKTAPKLLAMDLSQGLNGGNYSHMFKNCTSLKVAPELPATKIYRNVYFGMFEGCTSLEVPPPKLPANTVYYCSYIKMFKDCVSLKTAPILSFTSFDSLYHHCANMFEGCTSLTKAPALPATRTAESCYYEMFKGCTNLVETPTLPATSLVELCYFGMFEGCTALKTAPSLPATKLAVSCYKNMFKNCTSITTAPALNALTLVDNCYNSMFYDCSNLKNISMVATNISAVDCLKDWVVGVYHEGTFTKDLNTELSIGTSGIPENWHIQYNISVSECTNLILTAANVSGSATVNTVYWEATVNGTYNGTYKTGLVLNGSFETETFAPNMSETEEVIHTVSYTYFNKTATTTFIQGVHIPKDFSVNLNNEWELKTDINPDINTYNGVYRSFSNYHTANAYATMTITFHGYDVFTLYIRSYAESNYDYVMVSQLDKSITGNSSYSDTTLVKAHTRGNQKSGTSLSNYVKVEFTNISDGEHVITIVYRKDSSADSGDDRGYVLIPKQ